MGMISVPSFLACSLLLKLNDANAQPIAGGWSFSAYSNNERFSKAYVQGFQNSFERFSMKNKGVYAGNAKNSMISRWGDSSYLETSNIVVMQCHGNTSGPDLEYVPREFTTWGYKWGDKGRTQWIFIGGCDVLGFTIKPNGKPSSTYPSADRWNRVFKGISGILGYRSSSWYRKNDTNLANNTATVLSNMLTTGNTIVNSWIMSANYLHRVLGVKAEIAIFPNSRESLKDTLSTFNSSRTKNLDVTSIKTQVVGTGKAPCYHYSSKTDESGAPIAYNLCTLKDKSSIKLNNNTTCNSLIKFETTKLPIFKAELAQSSLGQIVLNNHQVSFKEILSVDSKVLLVNCEFSIEQIGMSIDDLISRLIEQANINGITLPIIEDNFYQSANGNSKIKKISMEPHIKLNSNELVRISDYGIELEIFGSTVKMTEAPFFKLSEQIGSKKCGIDSKDLLTVLDSNFEKGQEITILDATPLYILQETQDAITISPKVSVLFNSVINQSNITEQLLV